MPLQMNIDRSYKLIGYNKVIHENNIYTTNFETEKK